MTEVMPVDKRPTHLGPCGATLTTFTWLTSLTLERETERERERHREREGEREGE